MAQIKIYHARCHLVLFGGRLSMSFYDSTSDSTATGRYFVFALGRDEAFIRRFRA